MRWKINSCDIFRFPEALYPELYQDTVTTAVYHTYHHSRLLYEIFILLPVA